MPTNDGYVGPLQIPIPQVGPFAAFTDPVAVGLADYLAFWIRYGIASKYDDPNDDLPAPLPEANVFPFDPRDNWVRQGTPALYVWWFGESQTVPYANMRRARRRRLRLFYVAREVTTPGGARAYSGMPAAVDAIMHMASEHGYHADYGYDNAPHGTPIATSLKLLGWDYDGGKADFAAAIPSISPVPGGPGGGHVVRGFPVLFGTMTVVEEIDQMVPSSSESPLDIPLGVNINDPSAERGPLRVLDRYLISASEADDSGEE